MLDVFGGISRPLVAQYHEVGIIATLPWVMIEESGFDLTASRYLVESVLEHAFYPWRLRFYSVHFSHKQGRHALRANQAAETAGIIRERARPGELPPILVGDFNARQWFSSDTELSVRILEESFYRPLDAPPEPTDIDLIYVGRKEAFPYAQGSFDLHKARTVDLKRENLSDHYAVGAMLRVDGEQVELPAAMSTAGLLILDFVPKGDVEVNVRETGRDLVWKNVRYFTPLLTLSNPLDEELNLRFLVKEDKRGVDPTLGHFDARWAPGSIVPTEILTPHTGVGGRRVPGSPDVLRGAFWLGATKRGRIRSNQARGDDGHAHVYLRVDEDTRPPWLYGRRTSPRTTVVSQ